MKEKKEQSASMMFLDMLIKSGHTPKAVVVANTEKKEELYNTEEEIKNLTLGEKNV